MKAEVKKAPKCVTECAFSTCSVEKEYLKHNIDIVFGYYA